MAAIVFCGVALWVWVEWWQSLIWARRYRLQAERILREGQERDWQRKDDVDQLRAHVRFCSQQLVGEVAAVLGGKDPSPQFGARKLEVGEEFEEILATVAASRRQQAEEAEMLRLVVVALARRVQASAHRIQAAVSELSAGRDHDAPLVEACMRVDHSAAVQGRLAQSLAVLCGQWPGQQWPEAMVLVDIVRAAAARIAAYQRVEVSGDQHVAVLARVAEPLIHLLAEALANAAQSSPPASPVMVVVRRVERGVVVQVDDCGVGMDGHRLARARSVASGVHRIELKSVGEIPQTGLAVIGLYAREHGLQVDLEPSPYGGIRAVVLVPEQLLTTATPLALAAPHPALDQTSAGLPRRRRGHPAETPQEAADFMTALFTPKERPE